MHKAIVKAFLFWRSFKVIRIEGSPPPHIKYDISTIPFVYFYGFALYQDVVEFISIILIILENMGAHDIVDGNSRLTLGLIWTIILR